MTSHNEYQDALQEVKTLLDDMTKNEDEAFKYHYYVRLKSIELLQNLVDIYPEYVELKEKEIPSKPNEVEQNMYICQSCENAILPIGERKIWHKHFTPCCQMCGKKQDWSEDE